MPPMFENVQEGQVEDLADLISIVESDATPYVSSVRKGKQPLQAVHNWQAMAYPDVGHRGVVDGEDATTFTSTNRKRITGVSQKVWNNPAVSDFATEAKIAGLSKGEMSNQIAISLVNVKRIVEKRSLSDVECQEDSGVLPYETRGMFKWVQAAAQAVFPVAAEFRTPAACVLTGALNTVTESAFRALCRAGYKTRKGPHSLFGVLGIDLKAKFTDWTIWTSNVADTTVVRTFNQDARKKALVMQVDKVQMDTGSVTLHPSAYLWTDPDTGLDTNYTHRSGLFLDQRMCTLNWTRMPRVRRLEDKGGGPKAIVDAIFSNVNHNPLGHLAIKSNSDT